MKKHITLLPPPSWGRVGVGVVLSAARLRQAEPPRPHPTLPRLGGGSLASRLECPLRLLCISAIDHRQLQSLFMRAVDRDVISSVGMAHDAGAGIVGQHALDATGRLWRAVAA